MQKNRFGRPQILRTGGLVAAAAMPLILAGCGGKPPQGTSRPPDRLVMASAVVNALKCELAETFADGNYTRDMLKTDPDGTSKVEVTLSLGDSSGRTRSGEAGLDVEAFGIGFTPTGSRERSVTQGQSIDFEFSFAARDGMAISPECAALKADPKALAAAKRGERPNVAVAVVRDAPFKKLLGGIKAEYDKVRPGEPKVSFGAISYSTEFEVAREESFGAEVAFLVFKIGGTQTNSRSASQKVTLKFDLSKLPRLTPGV
ncbi:hypothetical protein [Sphingopyxis sp.]|uniref:hypothetical protein n=1 Tax=Sphingopyxis sp. TaxID=1908224 RepID=UPI003D111C86